MDEADLQAFQRSSATPQLGIGAHVLAGYAQHIIGRAKNKLCAERTQFRLSESYVLVTSKKGQAPPLNWPSSLLKKVFRGVREQH